MGKHAQIVMGPAGSGKSTYVDTIRTHCETAKRSVHCVNLDPAAEVFNYPVSIDIRELISVDEVMEELPYGPNGGLIYAMEYLLNNLDWLQDQLGDFDTDYLIIDCPGQIELYTHVHLMRTLTDSLQQWGYSVCGVFLLDAHFMVEPRCVSERVGVCTCVYECRYVFAWGCECKPAPVVCSVSVLIPLQSSPSALCLCACALCIVRVRAANLWLARCNA